MLNKLVSFLTGAPVEKVAEYFARKQELKYELKLRKLEGAAKIAEAKANAQAKAMEQSHEWALLHIRNSGWKDEFVLLILSIPLIMSFIPGGAVYVSAGFQVLGVTPSWYQWMLISIYAAIYGIKPVFQGMANKIALKKANGNSK